MNKIILLLIAVFICPAFTVTIADCAENKAKDKSGKLLMVEHKKSDGEGTGIDLAPPPPPLIAFDLPPISVTLNDEEPHFVKMSIALGYEKNDELTAELIMRKDEMIHIINILLHGKTFNELNSVSGAVNLSEEIKAHVNVLLKTGKIKEIYFKEFTVN